MGKREIQRIDQKSKSWFKDLKDPVFYYVFTPILFLLFSIFFNIFQFIENKRINNRLERLENMSTYNPIETAEDTLASETIKLEIKQPKELLKRFYGKTTLEMNRMFELKYKNKLVEWKGVFMNIMEHAYDEDTSYTVFFITADSTIVHGRFDKTWRSNLMVLQRYDRITVLGKLYSIELGVGLKDCQLKN